MPSRVLPTDDQLHDVELLVQSHHPLLHVESVEEERVETLFAHVADRLGMPLFSWLPHKGLRRQGGNNPPMAGTEDPSRALAYIEESNGEMLFHLRGFHRHLDDATVVARLKEIHRRYSKHRGAVVITSPPTEFPPDVDPLFTHLDLGTPTIETYHQFVSAVLRDIAQRRKVRIDLSSEDVGELLEHMRGLTFFEIQKIVTQAVVEDGVLGKDDLEKVLEAKKRIIQRSGVLEYFPQDRTMADVAGLRHLKDWLGKRKAAFAEPRRAKAFGLTPPKGLLLLGVQGCGKSLCAKAVASAWRLPLIRLDPSNLYQKFYGESEKNFMRATRTAEAMAPVVLWIDEIEKAFGQDDQDGGTSGRVFATFLAWLQEKDEAVFVLATANDVSKLPPELLRKGRFDEIFFVDLPSRDVRAEIFAVHLRRRERDPQDFDLEALAVAAEGFSGAEIEQAVVSGLYTAFSRSVELDTETLLEEVAGTRPLSVTMGERIDALRAWARDRAVAAD